MKRMMMLAAGLAFALTGPASAGVNFNGAQPDASKKTHSGIIAANASVVAGAGFTIAHNSTGVYTIVFPSGTFKTCPAVNVTPAGGNGGIPIGNLASYGCGNGGVTLVITMSNIANQQPQDNAFHFTLNDI
jgi:hypothetical protein